MKEFLSNPTVILIIVEVLVLVIAKFDKSNTISTYVKKLGGKLDS